MEAAANSRAQIEALVAGWLQTRLYESAGLAIRRQGYETDVGKPRGGAGVPAAAGGDRHRRFSAAVYHLVSLLTDPAVTGMARDVVLSDAMMGYLHFISGIPTQGPAGYIARHRTRWRPRRCR